MAGCPKKEVCTLLTDKSFQKMPGLLQRFRQNYCDDEFSLCARYKVAAACGDHLVPETMLPTQIDWAMQIIQEESPASNSLPKEG
jgi:hypothetical protein